MRHDTTLTDGNLTLQALAHADIPALCALARTAGDELRFMGSPPTGEDYYRSALEAPDHQPFTVLVDGEVAGSTRYGDIRAPHRGLEIGWTWLHPRWYGSGVNTRMKRLMLAHAFEQMGMLRVQIKTDGRNLRSQRAIEKLGAVREGVLRKHMVLPDGYVRDTVMYSITDEEWPRVKRDLEAQVRV